MPVLDVQPARAKRHRSRGSPGSLMLFFPELKSTETKAAASHVLFAHQEMISLLSDRGMRLLQWCAQHPGRPSN
jgi:hypothetical protein